MSTAFLIYLINVADNTSAMLGVILLLSTIIVTTVGFFAILESQTGYSKDGRDNAKKLLAKGKYAVGAILVLAALFVAVPSGKTLAAMIVVPAIMENKQVQGISENGLDALELLTKKWVNDFQEQPTESK